jgi:PhzF family phenazine biosynthesis protein
MKTFTFKKIDAFATATSGGNPAGAIYLNSSQDISVADMQRIARELKGFVSEVGYIAPLDENIFHLRYYSSEREVAFCGHATVGIMYDLIKHDQRLFKKERVDIVTNKGTLPVENRIQQEDAVFITAPNPGMTPVNLSTSDIAEALKIPSDAINADAPVSIINAGLETLLVPIRRLQAILAIAPDMELLKQFCLNHAIDIITVFCDEVADANNTFRTRVFAPTFGYLEDPATGSGNAAFGYYLLQQKRWDGTVMSLEQNGSREHPNIVKLMTQPDEEHNLRVVFGGGAIVRIIGEYLLS